MNRERFRRNCVRALAFFLGVLAPLAVVGLARPVKAIRWHFWAPLVIAISGLLVCLTLVLFHDPMSSGDKS